MNPNFRRRKAEVTKTGCKGCLGTPVVVKQAACLWGGRKRTSTETLTFAERPPREKPISAVMIYCVIPSQFQINSAHMCWNLSIWIMYVLLVPAEIWRNSNFPASLSSSPLSLSVGKWGDNQELQSISFLVVSYHTLPKEACTSVRHGIMYPSGNAGPNVSLHICGIFLLLWLNLPMFPFGPRYWAVERSFILSSFLLWKIFGTVQDTSRLTSITNSFASRREEAYGNICLVLVYTGFGLIDPFQISWTICQIIHQLLLWATSSITLAIEE